MISPTLHIINVRLPLLDDSSLYTVYIENGKWYSITEQNGRCDSPQHKPLASPSLQNEVYIDAQQRILLPGLVDAHMHLDKAFSLSTVGNQSGTLEEACFNYANAVETFSYQELRQRILRAALQSIAYGSSIIRTHIDFHIQLGKDVAMRGLKAALDIKEQLKKYITIQIIILVPSYQHHDAIAFVEEAIALGADGIGGAPYLAEQPRLEIETMFALAERLGCILDFHSDESDNPQAKTVLDVAELVKQYHKENEVTVGHLCSLASMPVAVAEPIIEEIASAQLHAVSLPGANLYLQGRGDDECVRRGVTRLKTLLKHGINVSVASDNIHDPFHPFGRGDLLQIALLAAYGAHMGSPADIRKLLEMISVNPAKLVGAKEYGVKEGHEVDFVIFDATTPEQLFMLLPDRRWVYRNEQWLKTGGHPFDFTSDELAKAWASLEEEAPLQ